MKVVSVRFRNYWRSYAFNTNLPLKEGKIYKVRAQDTSYSTSVVVEGYLDTAPDGIQLKEIIEAEEVFDEE